MGKHKFDEAVLESNKMLERNINSGYIAYWKLAKIARYQGKLVEAERFYTLSKENAQEFYDRYCIPSLWHFHNKPVVFHTPDRHLVYFP